MRIQITATIDALAAENAELSSMARQNNVQVLNMQNALFSPHLSGKTYKALDNRLHMLRIPVAQAQGIAFETLHKANCDNIAALGTLPQTSPGVLDAYELERQKDALRAQNNQIDCVMAGLNYSKLSERGLYLRYESMIRINNSLISQLEEKIRAATEYVRLSARFYEAAKQNAFILLARSSGSVNSFIHTGSLGDTSWISGLDARYKEALQGMYKRTAFKAGDYGGETSVVPPESHVSGVEPSQAIRDKFTIGDDPDGMVKFRPYWGLAFWVDEQWMTQHEADMLNGLWLWELFAFKDIHDEALAFQGGTDNASDAMRHTYWSARLTKEFGADWTREYTTAHEGNPEETELEEFAEVMDLHNNDVGIRIAQQHPDASAEELKEYARQAADDGQLLVIDKSGPKPKLVYS